MSDDKPKRKHRRTKPIMWSWTFEMSTDYAPQTATVIEVIRQAFEQRGAKVAIKEHFEDEKKGLLLIGKDPDSFARLYDGLKPMMTAVIKSLPTQEEIEQRIHNALEEFAKTNEQEPAP